MPLLSRDVYEALREIGVSDAQALRTAEALAVPKQELADLRTDLAALAVTLADLHHRLTILACSLGVGFVLVMAAMLLKVHWLWQLTQRVH